MSVLTPAIVLSSDDATANALISVIRGAVNGTGKYAAYVAAHDVTRDNVKVHAAALATLAYPNEKTVQTVKVDGVSVRTKYGNAVQAAGAGLRSALGKSEGKPSTKNLITREGAKAELDAVIAAWHAAQA